MDLGPRMMTRRTEVLRPVILSEAKDLGPRMVTRRTEVLRRVILSEAKDLGPRMVTRRTEVLRRVILSEAKDLGPRMMTRRAEVLRSGHGFWCLSLQPETVCSNSRDTVDACRARPIITSAECTHRTWQWSIPFDQCRRRH